uniref:Uncharacterized protein n=1 Tax=Avena sativa TaxID=4498 RepID=A0ACD6AG09_AVESA
MEENRRSETTPPPLPPRAAMDLSPYSGFIADPAKCRLLSVDAKRKLLCELSKCPDRALELLHEWTRPDIIQIFCSEFCKDRKYEGTSKQLILHYLFNAVNGKSSGHGKCMKRSGPEPDSGNKRQKKSDVPALPIVASTPVTAVISAPTNNAHLCENSACRASLVPADKFCKRCSCCICFKYDDNKDPSLWLSCDSDQSLQEVSCGLSCHLECAFRDERSGILQIGQSKKLDGGYYCTHCGKQNDLLGCWKKQLLIAKDARRFDVLCHRIFLSHKILISTQKYLVLHEIVDTAMKKLESELGPISGLPDKGRGIVGRLPVGAEVQKLCAHAIETLESMLSGALTAESQIQGSCMVPSKFIKLEDISHESITVVFDLDVCPALSRGLTGFNLWHRKASEGDYRLNPTGIIPMPSRMLVVRGLAPCTSYIIKVVAFASSKKIGSWVVRTSTVGCPKELDAKDSMPVDVREDPNNISGKENSSGLSNSSSEDVESDEVSTDFADLSSSSESDVERCRSLDILYSVKAPHHCNQTTNYSRDRKIDAAMVTEVDGPEKAPRVPASALDDNEEESGSAAQAALLKRSTELMACSQRALKQNVGTIGPEIALHAHTGNKSVAPPEYHGSLLRIMQKETENCKWVSGTSIEAKSDDHIPQDDSSKTETDPGCLPCKRTPGRTEDGGHKDGPSEPNTSAQVSSLLKSSNLARPKQQILLENVPGSLAPIAGNGIESGNMIFVTSSKSNDDHVPESAPLKPETEPGSTSGKNPSGKPVDIEQTDADAYLLCVKVIRWLECKGYVEANFRVKFLTWLSLRATRHEKRVVSMFVDTFIDDPASLAGQLSDTFSEAIYSKRPPITP